ncbi:MalY/PatB family protein [Brachyspira hampsonii]|uniref:cysteine-S-conjugate beta-lyase n=1 Tax=Brachyspira hampsonii 30446 TaxID=1289135 RepID=A0A2U4F278_9SPIR|nr:MalY/PatB family protein [Brachyspira hampsonii]EKV56427.1 bifunctional protein: repressor/cystathionine beta-lyase [Brachyspira hampsonii 30446]MBW5390576.1 pyridoxal phosphate-dependent aminotransferase [Brachyspira hampsonii]MBW5393448.1 pyridoxal phosphate-dependent aminotransferase [Brachyspira hampsonii]OEJ19872.1 beta-cystathionase [Brachyspira hampsonii]
MDFDTIINRKGTYCTQWDYIKDRFGVNDLLPFTISDMDLQSPEEIIDALIKRVNHKIFGYSRWNHDDFKNSIELWYKKRFNFNINKDDIVYSPSVIYSVSNFIRMKSSINDNILILTPAYDGFFKTIKANNRNILSSSLIKTESKYEIDFEDFEKKCRVSKIFLFCSPHNPVGRVWDIAELKKLVDICKKYNVYIISDEIHMDIVYNKKHIPILSVADYDNMILCTSASKTFNIPALGGSYLFIRNNKDRNEYLNILKDRDALSSPPILAIIATMTAYNKCDYWVDELLEYVNSNINYIISYLDNNIPMLRSYMPEGSYFAWVDYSKLNISEEVFQKYLVEIGKVAIMNGSVYGEEGKTFLRINCACSINKIKDCMSRITKTIEYLKSNNIINL